MTRGPLLSIGEEAGLALRCAGDAGFALRHRAAWEAVALVLAGKMIAVLVLVAYPLGPFARAMDSLLHAVGGDAALHFPGAYAAYPRLFALLDPAGSLLFAMPGFALLVARLPRILADTGDARSGTGPVLARLPAVFLVALPGTVLGALVPLIAHGLAETLFGFAGMLVDAGLAAAALALEGLLAFAVPAILLGGRGPGRALVDSARLATRFPRVTLLLLGLEALVLTLLSPSPVATGLWFESFPPEIVPIALGAGAVVLTLVESVRLMMFARLWLHSHGTESP